MRQAVYKILLKVDIGEKKYKCSAKKITVLGIFIVLCQMNSTGTIVCVNFMLVTEHIDNKQMKILFHWSVLAIRDYC